MLESRDNQTIITVFPDFLEIDHFGKSFLFFTGTVSTSDNARYRAMNFSILIAIIFPSPLAGKPGEWGFCQVHCQRPRVVQRPGVLLPYLSKIH